MLIDRCANRTHCLSTPPTVRSGVLSKNFGCMTCRPGADCPYRRGFDCSPADRDAGIELGFCAIEAMLRQELLDDADWALAWLPEGSLRPYAVAVARLADACLYLRRARAWEAVVFDRETAKPTGRRDLFGSPETRTARRYVEAGAARMLRTLRKVREFTDLASRRRAAGWTAKAHAAARDMLERLDPNRAKPKRLELANDTAP